MENNNRQGCRWTKAGDFVPENPEMKHWRDAETKEPTLWRAIKKIAVSENNSDQVEWLSIEPCATSSENENIVMKRIKQQEPDEAGWSYNSEFLREFTERVNEKDWGEGLSMEQVESVLITAEEYEHEKLKSQTPSPTGDRDCEELKKGLEEILEMSDSENYDLKIINNKAKQLLNL